MKTPKHQLPEAPIIESVDFFHIVSCPINDVHHRIYAMGVVTCHEKLGIHYVHRFLMTATSDVIRKGTPINEIDFDVEVAEEGQHPTLRGDHVVGYMSDKSTFIPYDAFLDALKSADEIREVNYENTFTPKF